MSTNYDEGPSWDDAPEWANYKAMDGNGRWFWYEKVPVRASNSVAMWFEFHGQVKSCFELPDWAATLQKRPNRN